MTNNTEIIQKCKEFLTKSSDYYGNLITRKRRDMEIYSGNFWNESIIESTDRKGRLCKSFTQYAKYMNAIVSPFSKSPYHADIEDPNGVYKSIQEEIDNIENKSNTKYVLLQALRHATITGTGFFILSTIDGKIVPEVIRDISQIALDPSIQELSGEDAEQGAIVNYISIKKAKRLYGDDVINSNGTYTLSNFGNQWNTPNDQMPIITYYEMNDKGTVDVYKLCGNLLIEDKIVLNISRIPIYRICFNEVVRNNKIDYNGIVDMTADIQFGLNLGYSTLLERANRSPKASYMMPAKALDGLDEFYRKLHTKESLVCLYNGDVAPQPIIETYQTQDLMNTINSCNELMTQVIGIPNGGVNPVSNNITATEILVQQANSESNVNALYENANDAVYQMNKSIIELLCWEKNLDVLPHFRLINGPTVITKLMKRRHELLAVSGLVDEKTKKIIAKQYIETLDEELKEPLLADIIANSPEIQFISDSTQNEDPFAVATLQNMNQVLNETQDELEKYVVMNNELKKQIDMLNMELLNQKQQQIIDYKKHMDEMKLKEQQLQLDAAESNVKLQSEFQNNQYKQAIEQTKLEKEIVDLEKKKLEISDNYGV